VLPVWVEVSQQQPVELQTALVDNMATAVVAGQNSPE
jgi:hypothetical protein